MSFAQLINKAASISTHAEKHAVLKQITDVEMLKWALDYTKPFWVKAFNMPESYATEDASYDLFYNLCEQLNTRELTGNMAKFAIFKCLGQYTEETANVLANVLKKDLKCGASINTFRELFPHLKLPRFELMGAGKVDEKTKPKYPCWGEVKYDGNRMITYSTSKTLYWSRKGLPNVLGEGFDEYIAELANELQKHIPSTYGYVFDGETYGENFSETQQAKGKDSIAQKQKLNYYVFDFMPYEMWINENCPFTQIERTEIIRKSIDNLKTTKIKNANGRMLNNEQEAIAFYKEALSLGFEGLILKSLDGLYCWNMTSGTRGSEWLKWKPTIDVDLTIIGYEEGENKNAGKLGKFLVKGTDENGNVIESGVGGFKVSLDSFIDTLNELIDFDKNNLPKNKDQWFRELALKQFDLFKGKIVKIEAQELSKAKNSNVYSLRFPYVVAFRNDK